MKTLLAVNGSPRGHNSNLAGLLKQVFNHYFVVSALIPLMIYLGLDFLGMTLNGIIASGSWSVCVVAHDLIKERKANILALLAAITSLAGLAGTIASGNPVLYLASPIVKDVIYAAVFLGSLFMSRPLIQMIVEDGWGLSFPDEFKKSDEYRKPWRTVTAGWGVLCLFQAALRTGLILSVPAGIYYGFSTIFGGASDVLLMFFSVWYPAWFWRRSAQRNFRAAD